MFLSVLGVPSFKVRIFTDECKFWIKFSSGYIISSFAHCGLTFIKPLLQILPII